MSSRVISVRERLWLLGHDERDDLRPHIDVRALGIGLAAAALIDLLMENRIRVSHGLIFRAPEPQGTPADLIARDILSSLETGPAPRLAEVLREARADLVDDVQTPYQRLYQRTRAGLVAAGFLREQHRRLRSTRYYLSESGEKLLDRGRLSYRVTMYSRAPKDLAMDSLIALVWALNLHSRLQMSYSTSEADPMLRHITEQIPQGAGQGSPLTVVPHLARLVRTTVGDLATAAF
jgi:hypothetical protein